MRKKKLSPAGVSIIVALIGSLGVIVAALITALAQMMG